MNNGSPPPIAGSSTTKIRQNILIIIQRGAIIATHIFWEMFEISCENLIQKNGGNI